MKPSAKVDGFFVSQCECFVFIFIYKKRNDFYISMQIEHIFMTYDGGAYNPSKLSYDPIAQEILDDPRVSNSLIFDKNRRTIYAQGLEYGKHHHTTSNNWLTSSIYDISQANTNKKAAEYEIQNIYGFSCENPKKIKYSCDCQFCLILDNDNILHCYAVDCKDESNVRYTSKYDIYDVEDFVIDYNCKLICVKHNTKTSVANDNYKFYGLTDGNKHSNTPYFDEITYIDFKDNFKTINIVGVENRDEVTKVTKAVITCDGTSKETFTVYGDTEIIIDKIWVDVEFKKCAITAKQLDGVNTYDDCFFGEFSLGTSLSIKEKFNKKDLQIPLERIKEFLFTENSLIYYDNYSIYDIKGKCVFESDGQLFDVSVQNIDDNRFLFVTSNETESIIYGELYNTGRERFLMIDCDNAKIALGNLFNTDILYSISNDSKSIVCISFGEKDNHGYANVLYGKLGEQFNKFYQIKTKYKGSSSESNQGLTKWPTTELYELPDVKIIWNEEGEMFVIIDEFGNASVFSTNDDITLIAENIATGVSGAHWNGSLLFLDNSIETLNKSVVVDVNLDIEGNLTYQTANLTMGTGIESDEQTIHIGDTFTTVSGINQSACGQVSYTYSNISIAPLTNEGESYNGHDLPNIVNVYMSPNGEFSYTYSDLETIPDDGSYFGAYCIDSPTSYFNVVTDISQKPDGKVTFSYQTVYTYHYGTIDSDDFVTSVILHDDGHITGTTGTFTNERTGETTSGVINNVNIDNTGKLSYSYVSLEDLLNVTPTGSDDGPHTLQNNTSYQVITNITQNANGSISYTYSNINTTHTSTGIVDRDIDDRVITNVHLDADGNFSYTYANHETTADDRLKAVKVGGDATVTLTGPSTSYTFVTQIDQTSDGKIIYTYAYVNTTHTTSTSNSNTNKVVTYVNLDNDGNLTYHLTDLSVTSGTVGSNMILTNDDTYKFITGITQASDGKISYTYSQLNTNFTYQGDNVDGPVYDLNIDKTGKISYIHKNLTVDSGVLSNDGDIITNDSTYRFITGISQASDGKISYTYGVFNTDFSNNGTTNGVLTNVNIDGTGKLSYDSVDLTVNSGNYAEAAYGKGVKIAGRTGVQIGKTSAPAYTLVLNGITQAADGKISYSYVGLYTDNINDYTYHDLTVYGPLYPAVQNGNVEVIYRISVDQQGNQTSHQLSYEYTQVPTREYVDGLITANDAMRYCGTFNGSGTTLSLFNSINPDNPDTSKGAVYKCSTACTISGKKFSVGDWIISNKDDASTTDITNGWDSFNVNITINSSGDTGLNSDKQTHVITNIYADDTGTISYLFNDLFASSSGTDDEQANELLGNTYKVLTGVELSQNSLQTVLSYTYTTIKVNQAHHSTNSASTGSQLTIKNANSENNVVTGVSLSADGTLSYTVQPLKTKSASTHLNATNHEEYVITYAYLDSDGVLSYHTRDLSVSSGTQGTAVDLRSSSINVIDGITQDKAGKIAYHYASISATQNHHSGSASGDFLTGVELSQSGTLSGSNGTFSTHNYGATSGVITYVDLTHTGQLSFSYVDLSGNTGTTATSNNKFVNGISQAANGKITYTYTEITDSTFANHHSTNNTQTGGASKVIGAVHLSESGQLSYSYTDIAKVAYHYTPTWPMLPGPMHNATITIPYNSTGSSESITAYINLTYDSKGHLIDSAKGNYSFAHGAVTTDGTNLGQKVITIAAAGTNSDDLKSYTSLTASNGHLTNATYGSYVFKHGAPSGGTTYTVYTSSNEYIKTLSFAYDTNGHITSYSYTLATADFNDEKTKFVSFTTNKIYIGGTKTQAGGVTTNTYIDGITYVNNGTVFMEKAVIGNSSDDTISINAKAVTFNTPDTQFNFTGLKALWGVVGS